MWPTRKIDNSQRNHQLLERSMLYKAPNNLSERRGRKANLQMCRLIFRKKTKYLFESRAWADCQNKLGPSNSMIRAKIFYWLHRALSCRRALIVRSKLNKTMENLIVDLIGLFSGKNEELAGLGEAFACCLAS